jgi:hypothetical protein
MYVYVTLDGTLVKISLNMSVMVKMSHMKVINSTDLLISGK